MVGRKGLHCSGYRLGELVTTLTIYLAPVMVGAAPFLALYWLLQPTVKKNPGLGAYSAPVATVLVPPMRSPESFVLAGTALDGAPAAEELARPAVADAKPDSRRKADSESAGSRNSRNGRNPKAIAAARNAKIAANDPARRNGAGPWGATNAFGYVPGGNRHPWFTFDNKQWKPWGHW
jgi:hypothetical protein